MWAALDFSVSAITGTPIANRSPSAGNDSYSTNGGAPLTVCAPGVLANDADPEGDRLTAALVSGPFNGTLGFQADGSFIDTPRPGFSGTDSFSYAAGDRDIMSAPATVC